MRKIQTRLMGILLLVAVVVSAGCSDPPPPPTPHKGGDGGQARPHGEAPGKGKKALPRLDD